MSFNQDDTYKPSILQEERKILREYSREIIEAAFFASAKPLSVRELAEEFGTDSREMRKLVNQLSKFLLENHGELQLSKLEYDTDKWTMHLDAPEHFIEIVRSILADDIPNLTISNPMSRQLVSVIAIYQPVSKAKIWKILKQKVKKDFSIELLEEKLSDLQKEGLISIHRSPSPLQYEITPLMMTTFGLEKTKIKLRNQMVRYLRVDDDTIIEDKEKQKEEEGEEKKIENAE
ncbi:MAG: SMC-Scp complex subunit ScpB [Candidatus Hodarchaeales archaeon]|jgi:chromosome segregation and condensation protein ScpB